MVTSCQGSYDDGGAEPLDDTLKAEVRAQFATTTDLVRYITAPTCAAQVNECHNSEDYPDLSSEGNLVNLVGLPCNVGVGERETIEDFCEPQGDQLGITNGSGNNLDFVASIGLISIVEVDGDFAYYEVLLDRQVPDTESDLSFAILRNDKVIDALGGGNSLQVTAGSNVVTILAAGDIVNPDEIRQGDENQNGTFGDDSDAFGYIVRRGDVRNSYVIRRLFGVQTDRIRMPNNDSADQMTEVNQVLGGKEMYALMSWINCMEETDGVYAPIRYDCVANVGNDGLWPYGN